MSKGKSMSWREPEYIDDDDFYDPDGGSNVLGGSGSRNAGGDFDEPAPGGRNRKGDKKTAPKAYKARNPAPSVASSEERRARLAGKHTPGKTRKDRPADAPDNDESARKGRLGGLRARFSRGENGNELRSNAAAEQRSRLGAAAGGIGRRLRDRFRSSKARPATTEATPSGAAVSRSGGRQAAARPVERSRASKTPKIESSGWLDLDRKLDLIGVALVFGAIVFVLSALSPERAAIGGLHRIVGQLLGWGVIALPLAMFSVGMWLIVRHFGDQAPIVDPVRLVGVALAFLGALVSLQYIDSLFYPAACGLDCMQRLVEQAYLNGEGGGLVGAWLYSALVSNLTEIGGFVVALMVLTFAAMMITRSSMAEMAVMSISLSRSLRTRLSQYAIKRRAARLHAQQPGALTAAEGHVRVSRPQPPQLTASPPAGRALPEPSAESMPIPVRLRELFGRRVGADATLESAAEARAPGVVQRLLNRNRHQSEQLTPATDPASKAGPVAALERFLNLGDDLPLTPSAEPVTERPPPMNQTDINSTPNGARSRRHRRQKLCRTPPRRKPNRRPRPLTSRPLTLIAQAQGRTPAQEMTRQTKMATRVLPPIKRPRRKNPGSPASNGRSPITASCSVAARPANWIRSRCGCKRRSSRRRWPRLARRGE